MSNNGSKDNIEEKNILTAMDDLIALNRRGFIPGPNEDLEAFTKRVTFCLSLEKNLLAEITPPGSKAANAEILKNPFQLTKALYDVSPDWVPVFFSNWKLAPWHGGAAWIFQLKEDSPLAAVLQLRKALYNKERYLGIYARDELIAHEFCHVGRMAFEEKRYEELLAYRTSKSRFARYFSPIIQSAFESRLIVYLLATLFMMDLFFLIQGAIQAYIDSQVFKILPLVLILFALWRLNKRQETLAQVQAKLQRISEHPGAILYRLTDSEIESFAKKSCEEIQAYVREAATLRWQVIRQGYFKVKSD